MIYDVDVVAVPEEALVSLRGRGPLSGIGRRMRRLRELVAQAGLTPAGPLSARFYDDGLPEDAAVDYDVCLPVVLPPDGRLPDTVGEAHGELVPSHFALEAVHVGPHDAMDDAWRAVLEAAAALGYSRAGPVTEVYEKGRESGAGPGDYVTRVRLPYAR